jgi:TetR/AcrR family transcriptional regulator of autoinduction and epiphytic fitness
MSAEHSFDARLTDRKRAAILAAAVKEFQAKGFDNTSMNRIAETAEVSKRTVYNHFESKDALFLAIVQELLDTTEALPEFPFDPEREVADQLSENAWRIVELFTSDSFQGLVRVTLSRFLMSPQLAQETIGDQKRFRVRLVRWIEQATAAGRLKANDHELAAAQFCGLLESAIFWPAVFGLEPSPSQQLKDDVICTSVEMFLARYGIGE